MLGDLRCVHLVFAGVELDWVQLIEALQNIAHKGYDLLMRRVLNIGRECLVKHPQSTVVFFVEAVEQMGRVDHFPSFQSIVLL